MHFSTGILGRETRRRQEDTVTTTIETPTAADQFLEAPVVAMVIRGDVITSDLVEFQGRGDSLTFRAPDPHLYIDRLSLSSPADLRDLYSLTFDEILDYLAQLGHCLEIETNDHMKWARELTYATAHATRPLIDNSFRRISSLFDRDRVREMADKTIGLDHLNGWVETVLQDGTVIGVRAFGARALHIIPGNGAGAAAGAIIKSAFTRSDCIIKTPSNNPFAASAIAQTMCEMAPDHPITKHVTVAYWRGGDEALERPLFQPHNVEKIIAWGGFASVKHVTRYIQPGLELIALDPKFSGSVIGEEALADEQEMRSAALRLAVDVGTGNQEPCSSSRVVYLITGGNDDDNARANLFGSYVYEELVGLPSGLSTKPKSYDGELRSNVDALRLQDDFYCVIGGESDEGCVIVSQLPDPVDFTALLADRTVNIVPVESVADVLARFDAYTQTIGVYPESLKRDLVDIAPLYGVQRFVSLGYSSNHTNCAPHDGIELERRMCKWIIDQRSQPIPLSFAASRDDEPDDESVTPTTLEAVRSRL
jgi:Acyl-CoA reductase (LuxC)